jgi:hypothetical protein
VDPLTKIVDYNAEDLEQSNDKTWIVSGKKKNMKQAGTVPTKQCCGSGAFLTPVSGIGKKSRSGSGINILDHISESLLSLETIFGVKILKFFDEDADPRDGNLFDPGSGIRDGKIRIRDPGC